jgi:hypothetical protein
MTAPKKGDGDGPTLAGSGILRDHECAYGLQRRR